jgi:hypothetical protein
MQDLTQVRLARVRNGRYNQGIVATVVQLDGSWSTKRMLGLEPVDPWERSRECLGLRPGLAMR